MSKTHPLVRANRLYRKDLAQMAKIMRGRGATLAEVRRAIFAATCVFRPDDVDKLDVLLHAFAWGLREPQFVESIGGVL